MIKKILIIFVAFFSLSCHDFGETTTSTSAKLLENNNKGLENSKISQFTQDFDDLYTYYEVKGDFLKNYMKFCKQEDDGKLKIYTVDELINWRCSLSKKTTLDVKEILNVPDLDEISFFFKNETSDSKSEEESGILTKNLLYAHHLLAITRISKDFEAFEPDSFRKNKEALENFLQDPITKVTDEIFETTMNSYFNPFEALIKELCSYWEVGKEPSLSLEYSRNTECNLFEGIETGSDKINLKLNYFNATVFDCVTFRLPHLFTHYLQYLNDENVKSKNLSNDEENCYEKKAHTLSAYYLYPKFMNHDLSIITTLSEVINEFYEINSLEDRTIDAIIELTDLDIKRREEFKKSDLQIPFYEYIVLNSITLRDKIKLRDKVKRLESITTNKTSTSSVQQKHLKKTKKKRKFSFLEQLIKLVKKIDIPNKKAMSTKDGIKETTV